MRRRAAEAVAVAAGLALAGAHPPLGWWWLSFLTVPALLTALALDRPPPDRARTSVARLGALTGIAAYAPMLWWLVTPAGFLGWTLLTAVQALYVVAFAVVVAPTVRSRWVVVVAPLAWTAMDAWRELVPMNGFGWGAIAYAHADDPWLLPVARLLGAHGVTLVVVALGAFAFAAAVAMVRDGPVRRAAPPLAGALALAVTVTLARPAPPPVDGSLDVLAVQGNDDDGARLFRDAAAEDLAIAERMAVLTLEAVAGGPRPDLTVWPESSLDRDPYAQVGADLRPLVERVAGALDGGLLVGVNQVGPRPRTLRNTSALIDGRGRIVDAYVKRRLVPFGEFVPLRPLLGRLPPLRQVPRDFVPGGPPRSLTVGEARVAVAICFETLFPAVVRDNVRAGDDDAGLLVATTNDASFGRSAEPAQHLAQSRLRAVETGRWVVHAALSGASAFVDPEGGVHDRTNLFTATTIRREVPLAAGDTLFLRLGGWLAWVVRLAALALAPWPVRAARTLPSRSP